MSTVADFNDSYERVIARDYDAFFKAFYQHFEASSPEIRNLFALSPQSRRYEMLESSILVLMDYSINHVVGEELERLAHYHAHLGAHSTMFDQWLESLIATLKSLDPTFSFDEEVSWRHLLGPGLKYLKTYI